MQYQTKSPEEKRQISKNLIAAAAQGNLAAVKEIMESGYDFKPGMLQALNQTIWHKQTEMFDYLLSLPAVLAAVKTEQQDTSESKKAVPFPSTIEEAARNGLIPFLSKFNQVAPDAVVKSRALDYAVMESRTECVMFLLRETAISNNAQSVSDTIKTLIRKQNENLLDPVINSAPWQERDFLLAFVDHLLICPGGPRHMDSRESDPVVTSVLNRLLKSTKFTNAVIAEAQDSNQLILKLATQCYIESVDLLLKIEAVVTGLKANVNMVVAAVQAYPGDLSVIPGNRDKYAADLQIDKNKLISILRQAVVEPRPQEAAASSRLCPMM